MSQFVYNNDDERVFPTLSIIVKKGDTFEAPEDFSAHGVSLVTANTKKAAAPAVATTSSAASDLTVGE